MKKQTDFVKKQSQGLDKVYEFDKKEGDETIIKDDKRPTLKKYNKSNLIYDINITNIWPSFYEHNDIKKFDNLSLESKYSFLADFFNNLDKCKKLKPKKDKTNTAFKII